MAIHARTHVCKAFSLIELLVVVSIVAVLLSLLLPSLSAARDNARAVVCLQNLKQISIMSGMYSASYKDFLVPVMGLGAPGRVMSYTSCNPSGTQFNSASGYNMSFMDLLNPEGIDQTNNEPINHNPMWYCPGDKPWRKWGTPIVREVNYAMSLYFSHFKTNSASDGLIYYKAGGVVNPSDKAFIVESHHKGISGVRSSDLQLYPFSNNSTVLTMPMVPSMYYVSGTDYGDSPRRHIYGFNSLFADGHATFIPMPITPVFADGAGTGGGVSVAAWSATSASIWFDPSVSYFLTSPALTTLWVPDKR